MDKVELRASLKRGRLFTPSRLTPSRTAYDTDLTDTEWESLVPLVPPTKAGGRAPKHSREILNGIFYAVRSGGAWKLLPHDLPPWRTVYHHFWFWRRSGVWPQIHDRTPAGSA
jgi:putative transposase